MTISVRFVVLGVLCGLLGCGSVTPDPAPDGGGGELAAGGSAAGGRDPSGAAGAGGVAGAGDLGGAPGTGGASPEVGAATAPACKQPPTWTDCGIEIAGTWQCVTACAVSGCVFNGVTYCAPTCGACR
jgi:hypothetical protein